MTHTPTQILIAASGLRDARIAKLTGMHPSTILRYRRGDNVPDSAAAIIALAGALGVSPHAIRPDLAAVFANGGEEGRTG